MRMEGKRWEVAEVGSSGILGFDMALPRYSQSLFVTSKSRAASVHWT